MTAKNKFADIKSMTFEEAMEELESIVNSFESGNVALDEAIKQYTRGAALREYCDKKLKEARLQVEKITAENDNLSTTPFNAD